MTQPESSESAAAASKPETETHLNVHVLDEQSDVELDMERYWRLATSVLTGEGVTQISELSITFVSADSIAALNEQHMGHEGPTDVLAFPIDEHSSQSPDLAGSPLLLGDVIICPLVAADNCSTNKGSYPGHEGSLTDEIDLLVVHGILHVLGMDHADDGERHQMQERERDHLAEFVGRNL